jgi:hypothetical protein
MSTKTYHMTKKTTKKTTFNSEIQEPKFAMTLRRRRDDLTPTGEMTSPRPIVKVARDSYMAKCTRSRIRN